MIRIIIATIVLLSLQEFSKATRDVDLQGLIQNRRSFLNYAEEGKLEAYLSSFGSSPNQSEIHEIFKRSPKRKVRKAKKGSTKTTTESPVVVEIPMKRLKSKKNGKNVDQSQRVTFKFGLEDAKYDEAYERLKKSRKIRVKRSSDTETNDRNKKAFVQPTEVLKFSIQDAVIKSPFESEDKDTKESENKNKRETPVPDSTPMDSKIHVTSPMRNYRSTKHVSYDEVSTKLQKLIESALFDAIQKGKATDGDFLKFFYGDKIIKVPVSMAKYLNFNKSKETLTSHVTKKVVVPPPKEENTVEELKLLTPNKAYYPISNHGIKFEATPTFLPTIATTTEKAETYVNFESPIYVKPQPEIKEPIVMGKSVYFYKNDENYDKKNSMTSPGPVLFEDSIPTTPSPIDSSTSHYENYIYHPPVISKPIKYATPIVEHVNESFDYIPLAPQKHHVPIHKPSSYVEYTGNYADSYNYYKNYEFGYHVSDYKTGNNFGHKQKSNKEGMKGEYSILLPDGRVQIVKYIANDSGFHADVSYQNIH